MTALISRPPLFGPPLFGLLLVVLLAALPAAPGHAATQHQTPATESGPTAQRTLVPQEEILVLRGGQVLRGEITRCGDRYRVTLPYGEILIRAVEVESCCRTLDEAYRLKRSFMRVGDVYGHIALAEWCLRNDLLDAAAIELADAAAADSKNPMVAHLQRRLKAALNPPGKGVRNLLPERPGGCFAQKVPDTFSMPSRNELDQLAKAMPPGTLEMFTDTIQPLLLNSCSTHDCHGPRAKSQFRLLRAHSGRAPSRRLTQRNLHAVMQWVDRKNPTASPLLTKPIEPHGSSPHGPKNAEIFNDKNVEQYRRLVKWVGLVVQHHKVQSLRRPGGVQQASHTTPLPPQQK